MAFLGLVVIPRVLRGDLGVSRNGEGLSPRRSSSGGLAGSSGGWSGGGEVRVGTGA